MAKQNDQIGDITPALHPIQRHTFLQPPPPDRDTNTTCLKRRCKKMNWDKGVYLAGCCVSGTETSAGASVLGPALGLFAFAYVL